jgi:hypothetical protein
MRCMSLLLAHCVISQTGSNSVDFGTKRTLSHATPTSRIMSTHPKPQGAGSTPAGITNSESQSGECPAPVANRKVAHVMGIETPALHHRNAGVA